MKGNTNNEELELVLIKIGSWSSWLKEICQTDILRIFTYLKVWMESAKRNVQRIPQYLQVS